MRKMTSGTMVVTMAATARRSQLASYMPEICAKTTGNGSSVRMNSRGMSSEFQQNRNCRMPTANTGDRLLGSTTWKKVRMRFAPRLIAADSRLGLIPLSEPMIDSTV